MGSETLIVYDFHWFSLNFGHVVGHKNKEIFPINSSIGISYQHYANIHA